MIFVCLWFIGNYAFSSTVVGPFDSYEEVKQDSIPIEDRYGDFITNDYYNPFDIMPSLIEQTVEYDFESGQYVVMEKIGDEYYRTPTYLTFEEYLEWQKKKQESDYLRKLSGIKSREFSANLKVDPISKIDIENQLADRLFGGTEVNIEPTGNVDLTFGADYQEIQNPNIPPESQRQGGFDFDMDINMGVDGKIGEKMNLGFNYNSQATFDFDNKLNLGYLSDAFSEDDIIKTIEAGNVNFPLKTQHIKGVENLFGLKTKLQFGRFTLTGVASQSRSEQETISLENGKLIQDFELRPDDYDENRHFFISHYNRGKYEGALENIPQVRSLMRITNIEVWVTNDQNNDLRNSAIVAAISYLGESDPDKFSDPMTRWPPNPANTNLLDVDGDRLPDNDNSDLFRNLVQDDDTRKIVNTSTNLQQIYGMTQVRDFEVQSMRRLNSNEFTYHPELGYISLNVRLRPNQVLGVAYEYTYSINGGELYKVGELTNESNRGGIDNEGNPEPEDVVYVKMLKSSNQRVDLPSWDLMMKNVYPLSASRLTNDEFQLDIFFEDYSESNLKRFIPEPAFRNIPLLDFFNLDRLNSQGDPQQDGIFDFIPGITVNTQTGSVIFPVLEPFGESLLQLLGGNQELYDRYGYPELYNNTITQARQTLDKNRFLIKGKLKSNISSEISLGTFNIPQGSVIVRAGSQILREGIDYDIDYGIGRIKILNDAYLQQGVPINVSFENQSLFSLQQKTMFGLRGEYTVNENFILGATYMRLFERPFTQKVNIGEDPINNRIFGLDLNYSSEAPFLTKLVDKLPFYSTNAPSSISIAAEVAALKPGHSGAINVPGEDQGVVGLDDFEGANSSIPLGSRPNLWMLASTPSDQFDEATLNNDLNYGVNRALLNWYVVDDRRIRSSFDQQDPYARLIDQTELFDRDIEISQIPDLLTFDLSYYPDERGPYNFDLPGGTPYSDGVEYDEELQRIRLLNPRSRWGGIMRYLPNNDFEAANYEYIEFWMLNPFIDTRDKEHLPNENGFLIFHLGNVSEDVLKDNLQFFENSIPTPNETVPQQPTEWGVVPLSIPNVQGFDLENQETQDLGFDGMNDEQEREKFEDYITAIQNVRGDVSADPANDNFLSYLDDRFVGTENILDRYRQFNGPQGNAPIQTQRIGIGNPVPDSEDMNDNRSLEQSEGFYRYVVPLSNFGGEIRRSPTDFITDERILENPSSGEEEKWYRFQIPISEFNDARNIQGFRSIQFLRMYMTGFQTPKTFRLAEFELVRNQWRRLPIDEECLGDSPVGTIDFVVDEVGIQENSNKEPFNYVLPKGIQQERLYNTFSNILQDENSLNLRICNLPDQCEVKISKLTELDIRRFEKLQMFVHAEGKDTTLQDGELSCFIRFGRDFNNNYYEYEIPLKLSNVDSLGSVSNLEDYSAEVWRKENFFDFPLALFTDAKKERNALGAAITDVYELAEGDPNKSNARVKIKGNPSLGYIKGMIIGLRNISGDNNPICAEVWVNELRLNGLEDRGGVAGLARLDAQLADLGNITMSANYASVGFGQVDQKLQERNLEEYIDYDLATNLELGKFFPDSWGLQIPFYAQFAKSIIKSEFDPYELDLTTGELLENPNLNERQIDDIIDRGKDKTTIRTFNFTNVRKNRTGDGTPKPWDVSNLSFSYSNTKTVHSDAIISRDEATDQRGDISYNYQRRAEPIQPFKNVNAKALRFIKEFNFNPIPNGFSFNTQLRRFNSRKLYRIPDPIEGFEYAFDDKRFDWSRNYSLQWDLTKSIKINYDASATAVVDEYRQTGIAPTAEERNWEDPFGNDVTDLVRQDPGAVDRFRWDNIKRFGRLKNYDQGLSINYNVPFKYFPGLDWITARASYQADYTWTAASLANFSLGNVIQNRQNRSVSATFGFDKLYGKVGYLKKIEGNNRASARRRTPRGGNRQNGSRDREEERQPSAIEKILIRPLMSLREVRFTYREDLSTAIPGFVPSPKVFGMIAGYPGWGFVFGLQPDLDINNPNNWLRRASSTGRITTDRFQNQQVLQNRTQNLEAKIKLEPWRDFDIDVDFKKTYTENHAEDFVNTSTFGDAVFEQLNLRDLGSYEYTYFSLGTLFDDDINGLFKSFENNRAIISARLPNADANPGPHDIDVGYTKGYGRQHTDVLLPAFLAAYTGDDPNTVSLNITDDVSKGSFIPKPNWTLRYNGLSKLPWFQDIFSSLSISHGYKSTLAVSRYTTDLQYNPEDPYFIDPDISTGNYFARFEIPEVVIDERFQPIIGIDMKTTGNINLNFEFLKSRNLQFSTGLGQLTEGRSTQYTIGFGWTIDDLNIPFLTGQKRENRRRGSRNPGGQDAPAQNPGDPQGPQDGGPGNGDAEAQPRTFVIDFTFDYRDDVTYIHDFDSGKDAEPTRGLKSLRIGPSIEYDINKNFTMRLFVDYSRTRPYLSTSYPITSVRGGLTARFNLN